MENAFFQSGFVVPSRKKSRRGRKRIGAILTGAGIYVVINVFNPLHEFLRQFQPLSRYAKALFKFMGCRCAVWNDDRN